MCERTNSLFSLLWVMETYLKLVDRELGMIETMCCASLPLYCNKSCECYQLVLKKFCFLGIMKYIISHLGFFAVKSKMQILRKQMTAVFVLIGRVHERFYIDNDIKINKYQNYLLNSPFISFLFSSYFLKACSQH